MSDRPTNSGEIYFVRLTENRKKWWIVFNAKVTMIGRVGETMRQLRDRWIDEYAVPTKIIRFKGLHRQSEAAMTIADIQQGSLNAMREAGGKKVE